MYTQDYIYFPTLSFFMAVFIKGKGLVKSTSYTLVRYDKT